MDTVVRLLADGALIALALVAVGTLLVKTPAKRRYETYTRILMAGLTSYVSAKLIASVYQPELERPFEKLGVDPGAAYLNNPGFPSDHMLFATFLVLAVWYVTRNIRVTIILGIVAALMGIARVMALVHTPLDVVGGALIALIGAIWYTKFAILHKK